MFQTTNQIWSAKIYLSWFNYNSSTDCFHCWCQSSCGSDSHVTVQAWYSSVGGQPSISMPAPAEESKSIEVGYWRHVPLPAILVPALTNTTSCRNLTTPGTGSWWFSALKGFTKDLLRCIFLTVRFNHTKIGLNHKKCGGNYQTWRSILDLW